MRAGAPACLAWCAHPKAPASLTAAVRPACAQKEQAAENERARLRAAQEQEEQCAPSWLDLAPRATQGSQQLTWAPCVSPGRFTRLNGAKIAAHWRRVMRAAKVSSLREQAAALAEEHVSGQARGAAFAAQLRRDLATAVAQHATAVRSHLAAVDALLELQAARVAGLRDAFEERAQAALQFLEHERAAAGAAHAARVAALRADIDDIRSRAAAAEAADNAAFEAERHAIVEATTEELQVIKLSGEATLAELEAALAHADRAHEAATADTAVAVDELVLAEAASAAVVASRTRELARLTESAATLKSAAEEGQRELEARVAALRAEKDAIFARHSELKRDMDRSRGADAALLRGQVVASAARAKALSEVLAKAQRVLRMAELNASVDATQRAALAAAGVVEQPGMPLSEAAARERARLRADDARSAAAANAAAQAAGAVPPALNAGLAVEGLGLTIASAPLRVKSPPRPGTTSLGGTQRGGTATAASGARPRPAVTRPASSAR